MKHWLAVVMMAGTLVGAGNGYALAQAAPAAAAEADSHDITDEQIALMRQDIRSKKKQLIAQNLKLSDAEATGFWPVYDDYQVEVTKIKDRKYAMIQEYAAKWGTMTDDQALDLTKRWLACETDSAKLRERFLPIVSKVLDGVSTATFFQMEGRISMMVDLQVSAKIPLAQFQDKN